MVAAAETVEWIQVDTNVDALLLENDAHQAAPAPVQRAPAGRQELPVPGRDARRRVAPAHGDAGQEAQGRALLRALRAGLRHPGDPRPPAAHLPAAHLLGQQVQLAPEARPAVPALPHREVLGALRRCGDPRRSTTATSSACSTSSTATPTRSSRSSRPAWPRPPSELEFEQAARLRDRLSAVRKAIEKQQMVAERSEDFDVIGLVDDELEAAVQVFFVRAGGWWGARASSSTRWRTSPPSELIGDIVERLYDDPPQGIPKLVLVPTLTDDDELYEEWLSSLRGSRVRIRVPQRGEQAGAPGDGDAATPRRSSSAIGCAGRRTTTAGPGPSTSCRTTSACPTPRCASSATT